MRRTILCVLAALWIALPALARADSQEERGDRSGYTQEDSHPLKVLSYIVAPIGFVVEWTVMRPLHYLATDTPLAPVFNGERESDENAPPPIAELPPIIEPMTAPAAVAPGGSLHEEQLPPAAPAVAPPARRPPAEPAPGEQPILH